MGKTGGSGEVLLKLAQEMPTATKTHLIKQLFLTETRRKGQRLTSFKTVKTKLFILHCFRS